MQTVYSKPAGDIGKESKSIIDQERDLQKTILRVTDKLAAYPERKSCLLCAQDISASSVFQHRSIPFRHCNTCGHVQTVREPDAAYEKLALRELGYEGIYPELDPENYKKRCEKVYKPKADWIEGALTGKSITDMTWCDAGCGTGAFLYALRERGCQHLSGFDIDAHNLAIARKMVGTSTIEQHGGELADAISARTADIFTAFFVLEHVTGMQAVIKALKEKPAGTYFAFSVPVFGFITLFESTIRDHYPRNLDAMMHTQIYTEASISYFLKQAGYDKVSEWVFGQDSIDIQRFLAVNLAERYPEPLYGEVMEKVSSLVDPLQQAVDRAHFSDARHILAVRRG